MSPYIGAKIELAYDSFGVNSATLTGPGFKDGGIHTFSATLDPIIHLNPHGHVDFYVLGGGGIYHHYWDFRGQLGPNNSGVSPSYGINKPGVDIGGGVAIGTRWHGKVFAEARWNRIFLGRDVDYIPVTFGFRW